MMQAGAISVQFKADIQEFLKGFQNVVKHIEKFKQEVNGMSTPLRQAQQRLDATAKEVEELTNDFKKTTNAADQAGTQMRQTAQQIELTENAADESSDSLDTLGEALVSIGLTVGTFTLLTNEVTEFTNALKKLGAQTGKTGQELKAMQEETMGLFREGYGEGIDHIADAVSQAKRMFTNVYEEYDKVAEAGLRFNKIFGEDTKEVFKAASRMSDAFGTDGVRNIDIITKAIQETGDPANDLLDTFWEYGNYMTQLGYSVEEFSNRLIYGLNNGAFNADKIGDAFKEVELRVKGLDKNAQAALMKMGLSVEGVIGNLNRGGVAAKKQIDEIFLRIGRVQDTAERKNIITALTGAIGEDLGDKFFTNYNEAVQMTINYQDTLSNSFEEFKENNIGYSLSEATRSFKELGYTIWNSVGPGIIWLAENISKAVQAFTDFLKEHPRLAAMIGTVIALGVAFGAFITAVLTVSQVIKIWGAFVAIVKTWTIAARIATAAQWLWNIALAANPIGIIIMGIAALITLIGVLINKMGGFGNFFKGIGRIFKAVIDGIMAGLRALGNFFTNTLPNAILWFIDVATKPLRFFLDLLLMIPRLIGKIAGFEIPMLSQMDIAGLGGGSSKTINQTTNVSINTNSVSTANTPTLANNISNYIGKESLRY